MAEAIPGAAFVELPGDDHLPWVGDSERVLSEIEAFLTGVRGRRGRPRARRPSCSPTSSARPSEPPRLGDLGWGTCSRPTTGAFAASSSGSTGTRPKTTGDGFLATFDGPARAVRCAQRYHPDGSGYRHGSQGRSAHGRDRVRWTASVHGIAVHIGARVGALAGAGEVLVPPP